MKASPHKTSIQPPHPLTEVTCRSWSFSLRPETLSAVIQALLRECIVNLSHGKLRADLVKAGNYAGS